MINSRGSKWRVEICILSANQDAFATGDALGVKADNCANFRPELGGKGSLAWSCRPVLESVTTGRLLRWTGQPRRRTISIPVLIRTRGCAALSWKGRSAQQSHEVGFYSAKKRSRIWIYSGPLSSS